MSSDTLRQQQWDAYWEAALARRDSCRVCREFHRQVCEDRALANATDKEKRAYARRTRRALRPYLAPDVVLPKGTPAPELMREAAKHAVTSVDHWAENAPAHGCHEMRKRLSSRKRSGVATWGKSYPKTTYNHVAKGEPTPGYVSCGW